MSKEKLRDKLTRLDRQILNLVAQRIGAAKEIGALKRAAGESTRDFRREKNVIDGARSTAAEIGLEPDLAESLLRLLIRSSLTAQERDRVVAEGKGDGRSALVIGGSGRMGYWFARYLASQGFQVEIADPEEGSSAFPRWDDWRDTELDHDMIVVATPLRIAAEVLEQLAERRPRGLVFDIGSLKTPLRKGLNALRESGCRVTSVHPMFGPDTQLLSGRHVLFVDVGVRDATDEVIALFDSTMAQRVGMNLDDHDRMIAYVLGLSHALNVAFVTALNSSGEAAPELIKMSSTTFDAQFHIAAGVAEENPHLYFEIQRLNDYGDEALEALNQAVTTITEQVRGNREDEFVALMEAGQSYVHGRPPLLKAAG
jgi:chorismate mutase/prephenate dehydrogenase